LIVKCGRRGGVTKRGEKENQETEMHTAEKESRRNQKQTERQKEPPQPDGKR